MYPLQDGSPFCIDCQKEKEKEKEKESLLVQRAK